MGLLFKYKTRTHVNVDILECIRYYTFIQYLDNIIKNLVTRNVHVQYESSIIYYLEVMTNVIFKDMYGAITCQLFI